jgi:hypothetical protein
MADNLLGGYMPSLGRSMERAMNLKYLQTRQKMAEKELKGDDTLTQAAKLKAQANTIKLMRDSSNQEEANNIAKMQGHPDLVGKIFVNPETREVTERLDDGTEITYPSELEDEILDHMSTNPEWWTNPENVQNAFKWAIKNGVEIKRPLPKEADDEFGEPYIDKSTGSLLQKNKKTGKIQKIATPPRGMVIESDGKGGFTMRTGVPTSAEEKRFDELAKDRTNTETLLNMVDTLKEQISNEPTTIGWSGALTRFADSLRAQVGGVSNFLFPNDPPDLLNVEKYDFSKLTSMAVRSAKAKSAITSLAYFYASTVFRQEGRGLSDKDMQKAIDAIGGATGSTEQLMGVLDQVQEMAISNYESKKRVIEEKDLSSDPFQKYKQNRKYKDELKGFKPGRYEMDDGNIVTWDGINLTIESAK